MRYSAVWPTYAQEWDKMVVTSSRRAEFTNLAVYAHANKTQYKQVEDATGVPWAMVAVIHRRESDGDFSAYLGNGQPLHSRTTIVPRGRGPFPNFLAGAVDALDVDGLNDVKDWRLEKQLYWLTAYNGWGYWPKPSPYVWGGTNIQVPGKYTLIENPFTTPDATLLGDHIFNPHLWDTQPGCAPLLAAIAQIDPTVKLERET